MDILGMWEKIKGGGITVTGISSGIFGAVLLGVLNARGANISQEELVAAIAGWVITIGVVRRMYNFMVAPSFLVIVLAGAMLTSGCSTFSVDFHDDPQTGTHYASKLNVAPFGKLGEGIAAMGYNWDQEAGEISVGQNVKDVDNTAQVDVVKIAVEAAVMALQAYITSGASVALAKIQADAVKAAEPREAPASENLIIPPSPKEPEEDEEESGVVMDIPEVEDE